MPRAGHGRQAGRQVSSRHQAPSRRRATCSTDFAALSAVLPSQCRGNARQSVASPCTSAMRTRLTIAAASLRVAWHQACDRRALRHVAVRYGRCGVAALSAAEQHPRHTTQQHAIRNWRVPSHRLRAWRAPLWPSFNITVTGASKLYKYRTTSLLPIGSKTDWTRTSCHVTLSSEEALHCQAAAAAS